jgi:hypothetical protein
MKFINVAALSLLVCSEIYTLRPDAIPPAACARDIYRKFGSFLHRREDIAYKQDEPGDPPRSAEHTDAIGKKCLHK